MAGKYNIGRVSKLGEFTDLQKKVDTLYDTYDVS